MNATATSSPVISRARVLIAALISFLLVVAGAALAPPATAAGASVAATVTSAGESGISVQVSASGLGEVTASYVALIVKGTESSVTGSSGYAAVAETPVAGGEASLTLSAPAGALDREKDYEVIAWATRSTPNSSTIYGRGDVSVSTEQWDAVFGAEETDPGETDPGKTDPGETDPTEPGETDPGETDPGETDPGETDPTDPGDTDPGDEEPAAPKLTVSKTQDLDPEGETLTITAENYDTSAVSRHGSGKAGFYFQVGWISEDWRPSEGAPSAARASAYSAWIADAANTFASATWTENGDGTADATWEIEVTEADLLAKKIDGATLAVFTVGAGGVVQAGSELAVPIAFATATPEPAAPKLTVSKTQDLDPEGETLTVTAENYDTSAVSRHGSGKAGFYFQVGWIADDWRPSEGAPSAARSSAHSEWVADAANSFATITWSENGDGTANATWQIEVTEAELLAAQKAEGGHFAVFTVGAGGVVQAGSELAVPLAFAEPVPTGPSLTVSKTQGLDPEGETLTITAKNYDTSAVSRYGSGKAGFYFQVGWIAEDWRPSEGAPAAARASAYSAWAADAANSFATVTWTENGDGTADATWVVEVTEAALLAEQKVDGGKLAVFTVGAGGVVQAGSELAVPIAFAGEEPPTTPNPPKEEPGKTPQGSKAGGSLRWAISTSFTDYITGSIAQGAIQVSGGATRSGNIFQFGQSTSSYDAETGLGAVSYRGTVRFTGHHGVLDVTMSNPRITITSAGSATLSLRNGGSEVPFATLDLSSARKSTANGAVTFTGAPATLTSAGRDRVLSGYSTVLDPVTFTIGSTAAAPNGSTGTVATASVQEKEELPDAPPATSGIEIDDANLEALQSGGQATVTGSGFQPNEQDIKVVVYSTPVLLDTVSADADGVATWTGTLPATLADGEHTLTLQGSVTRGLVFTLDRSASAALGQCTVEGASLNWGFKESFRTYIEGIANGGWELDGVVYEYPEYVWSAGAGSFDPETGNGLVTYGGTIEFTGHDGALDTTLANARLEFAGDTGYLVFDVTGTTQGGEAIDQQGVRFAEFALGDVAVTDGVISLDALPATLTEAGAAAFGTYAAGEALDPVSAVVPVDAECGTAPVAEPEAETAVTDTQVEDVPEETGDAPVWPWIAGGAVLLVLAFAAGLLVARRTRNGAADADKETADA